MATFSVTITPTSPTSAYLSGSFVGGDAAYAKPRSILLTIAGFSFYVISNESSGADNTFDVEIIGLAPGTRYEWTATLCYSVSSGWYPTSYIDDGEFTTAGGPEELSFELINARVGGFDVQFYGAASYAMRVTVKQLPAGTVVVDTVLDVGKKGTQITGATPSTQYEVAVVAYGDPITDLGTQRITTLGLSPQPTVELSWATDTALIFKIVNDQGYECKCTLKHGDTIIDEAWLGHADRLYPSYEGLTENTWYTLSVYINIAERDTGGIALAPFSVKTRGKTPVTAYIGMGNGADPKPATPYICVSDNGVLRWLPYSPQIGT